MGPGPPATRPSARATGPTPTARRSRRRTAPTGTARSAPREALRADPLLSPGGESNSGPHPYLGVLRIPASASCAAGMPDSRASSPLRRRIPFASFGRSWTLLDRSDASPCNGCVTHPRPEARGHRARRARAAGRPGSGYPATWARLASTTPSVLRAFGSSSRNQRRRSRMWSRSADASSCAPSSGSARSSMASCARTRSATTAACATPPSTASRQPSGRPCG
ncbi:MAG: hypothetical protein RLZZ272_1662 [Actinomycetota bacterium]|jgi:hypothetical protein